MWVARTFTLDRGATAISSNLKAVFTISLGLDTCLHSDILTFEHDHEKIKLITRCDSFPIDIETTMVHIPTSPIS